MFVRKPDALACTCNPTTLETISEPLYNAVLAMAGATQNFLSKIMFGIVTKTTMIRKLCYFFKLSKYQSSKCLFNNIPSLEGSMCSTRNIDNIPQFNVKYFTEIK